MHITSRVTLGLEKSIEIPERAFNKSGSRHFIETHLEKNFAELRSNLHERVQVSTLRITTSSIPVLFLKLLVFPSSRAQHLSCQSRRKLFELSSEGLSLISLESFSSNDSEELSLLHLLNYFLVVFISSRFGLESLQLILFSILDFFHNALYFLFLFSTHLNPFVFHGLTETNLSDLSSNTLLNISLKSFFTKDQAVNVLLLSGTFFSITSSFSAQFN